VEVREKEFQLVPSTIGLQRIGYFAFRATNDGEEPHALAVSGPGISKRTEPIDPGDTGELVVFFRNRGVYELYCPLGNHRQQGMTATIHVD
jgi:uncharacterized cupredoxin-like copper-binding protein